LRDELQRKKDFIASLKSQKEQTTNEVRDIAADLDTLKDDNAKLQRLIKENSK
jgi:small-conductance mechanosensitive channel